MLGTATRETQTTILGRVLAVLKDYKKVILGDREFCSVDLAKWLQEQEKTYFCNRAETELLSGGRTRSLAPVASPRIKTRIISLFSRS